MKTIYKLKIMILEKEQLPNQWNEGIMCPLYKKGDRPDCTNYRPITLLIVARKIYLFILFYFHISHLGTYHGNGNRHIQYASSDNLHMV